MDMSENLVHLIPQLEMLRAEGAVVVLKWDGERRIDPHTVVITRKDTDFVWRRDSSDIAKALAAGIAEYRVQHPK